MASAVCWGQEKPCIIGGPEHKHPHDCFMQPASLKCGKYEEFQPSHAEETNLAAVIVPDRCVPILHTVTEKEWQELIHSRDSILQTLEMYKKKLASLENLQPAKQ